ncbi:GNAT family N-acetyltransferase [Streptomyces sp. WAC04114]|uniref:GNAT family N-acetyltransferase n=1 Tax=Streptomyces sp. WAC04114 TaxID=2867961 RepID=UPI001C8B729C|nr:GNAT family N-acetyltransferase [Streptomyces sp. WAC04114]MBX9362060.1 GNAT family N-acetyltransferase [Streptomyces sp. WAC04114]
MTSSNTPNSPAPAAASPTLSATEITTPRLRLRAAHDADRAGLIELQTDPQVRLHLGGPRPRSAVEQYFDARDVAHVTDQPGTFVIADRTTDDLLGVLLINRRPADLPGHVSEEGGELELTYVLRRAAWGAGLAFEAATAALRTAASELPDQPVLIVTQTANTRSLGLASRLGFRRVGTFEAYEAEQTLAVAGLHTFSV